MRRTWTTWAVTVAALALTACTASDDSNDDSTPGSRDAVSDGTKQGSSTEPASHKQGGPVTLANAQGHTWSCDFNPFNPALWDTSFGFAYEPLVYVNPMDNGKETPMLAESFEWAPDKKSIVFTIRSGIQWSDGTPFTADDVVFTFALMKDNPGLDLRSLYDAGGLESVTAVGNDVTMTFARPAQPYFYYFAGKTPIVPQHIWGTGDAASSPDTYSVSDPIGTGPFLVESCSPNSIQYKANPDYWQPGKPYLQSVTYPSYLDNGPANLDLATDKAQWGGQYIPNIEVQYLSKSKFHNTWPGAISNALLFPNLDPSHPLTSDIAVRKAIALALDRKPISEIGESGQQAPSNQTGVVLPTFEKYFDKEALDSSGYAEPDPDAAKEALESIGYSPSDPLHLEVITVTGFSDGDASLAVMQHQLSEVGIELDIRDLANETFSSRLAEGDFDLAYYSNSRGGPSPFYELNALLASSNTAPIGEAAASNFERYENEEVDQLLVDYASADDAGQVAILKQVQAAVLRDLPFFPITQQNNWDEYDTKDLAGWPTADDPYAQGSPYNTPDMEQVLLHLYSKSAQ